MQHTTPLTGTMRDSIIRLLRYLLGISGGVFLSQMISLGVSFWYVLLAIIAGLFFSNYVLKKETSLKKVLIIHLVLYILYEVAFKGINLILSSTGTSEAMDLYPGTIRAQVSLLLGIYVLSFLENILFWTRANFLIVEIVLSGIALTLLLSGHRNYNIDMPNALSSLTWKEPMLQRFGVEPQQLLIYIAFIFAILALLYAALAAHRTIKTKERIVVQKSKSSPFVSTAVTAAMILLIAYSASLVLSRYNVDLSQVMNGVGPSSDLQNGESNLGFNEASQPSNQPAALLRLLNSYENNPWGGMLYLREGALSEYGGREMVKAHPDFDTDIPHINPNERTSIKTLGKSELRKPIKQAVYVLSEKIFPFAIDAPIEFIPIKNPNPKRFRYSYTAQSMALAEPLDSFKHVEVGDPQWSKEVWEHYLRAPGSKDTLEFETKGTASLDLREINKSEEIVSSNNEDLRYLAMSRAISDTSKSPMENVFSIIDFLSQESIYVLKPGHQLSGKGDPVAPYLFADRKRGYCVHFAHAAVYLLRLAGIPARIGTGFLVDLQYAKGGDILVQMGDRHAWPEVYIRDRGWVAIDVSPAQAENDQVAVPDESLLEQLMSEIDPIEELLGAEPKLETIKEKKSPIEEFLNSKLFTIYPLYILTALFACVILIKIYMRHAWRFVKDPFKKIRYSYVGAISTLEDIGAPRAFGETRIEYAKRLEQEKAIALSSLTKTYLASSYDSKTANTELSSSTSESVAQLAGNLLPKKSFSTRVILLLSYLNPASLKYITSFFKSKNINSILLFLTLCIPHTSHAIPGIDTETSDTATSIETESSPKKSPETLLREGVLLYQTGRGIDARAKFEELLAVTPNDYQPYYHLGQYYLIDVGHFKLAYRYLKRARELFEDRYTIMGPEFVENIKLQNEYSILLYLVAESALNLDFYEESLQILNEYAELYQSPWFPGQKAWILMKLKRVDEAIEVAKQGLLQGADPKRTWNILGILLSISGQRELSIEAFARAVDYEFTTRGSSQAATPLNNSGEVYRELFQDQYAESAWRTAIRLPDGCEHILPSINLSILYTDQLRIYQAMQTLADFEACFAQKPERKDTEHRTILALARGKLQIFLNNPKEAIRLISQAASDQQWFGKIGTNENDVKFAAWAALSQANVLEAERLLDTATESIAESLKNRALSWQHRIQAWWLNRTAKLFAVNELHDFEDLPIRHTDTMITYPLLGSLLADFDTASLKRRLERLIETDRRKEAIPYYKHYLARNYFKNGKSEEALSIAIQIQQKLLPHELLIKAENIALMIKAEAESFFWWKKKEYYQKEAALIEELFLISPVHLRLYNIPLPIHLEIEDSLSKSERKNINKFLLQRRFILSESENPEFKITVSKGSSKDSGESMHIQLYHLSRNRKITSIDIKKDIPEGINKFIQEVFSHKEDPSAPIPPVVPFMKKYGNF